jgi:hypothetical protein
MQLTIDVGTLATGTGNGGHEPFGVVESAEWIDARMREIGQAQGWCYPADRAIVLWEAYVFDWFREEDPLQDEVLGLVWPRFEHRLVAQLPDAERIYTPAWEDLYPWDRWQEFLATLDMDHVASSRCACSPRR